MFFFFLFSMTVSLPNSFMSSRCFASNRKKPLEVFQTGSLFVASISPAVSVCRLLPSPPFQFHEANRSRRSHTLKISETATKAKRKQKRMVIFQIFSQKVQWRTEIFRFSLAPGIQLCCSKHRYGHKGYPGHQRTRPGHLLRPGGRRLGC